MGLQIYDRRPHPSLTHSPREAFELGIVLGGKREIRRIDYDDNFRILTLPSPDKRGTRKVQPRNGIKINLIYYWCDAFRDCEIEGKNVDVKIDPFNAGIAYAYVKNQWRQCVSNFYPFLKGRTEKELKVLSEDLRQRKRGHGKRTEISDAELIKHLQSAKLIEGELLTQTLKARENQQVLDLIFDTSSPDRYSVPLVSLKSEDLVIEAEKSEIVDPSTEIASNREDREETNFVYYGEF